MIRWLYDLGFLVFGLFSLPHFVIRLGQAEKPSRLLAERFGFFSDEVLSRLQRKRPIWIHGVSVGEVLAVEKLIEKLLSRHAGLHLIVTTVTPTGQRIAKSWEGDRVTVLYFPFDLGFSVKRFFELLKPSALLLVETEIWPNVIEEAGRRGVPVGMVNGRISDRSARAFRRFGSIFNPVLKSIDFFLVQTHKDEERLTSLGIEPDRVRVTGNMKLDVFESNGFNENEKETLREKYGFSVTDQILIGGSTHAGEEEILLKALRRLREEGFTLKLLLAPRHIERSLQILEQAQKDNFETNLASRLGQKSSSQNHPFEVLILDRLGELRKLYGIGDIVFMGGSLVRHGGQNPIEPACFARPILHGPWVFNFEEIYRRLEEEGAGIQVRGEEELTFALKRMLASEQERRQLGEKAYAVLEKLRGATDRTLNWLEPWINIGKIENGKLCRNQKLFSARC